MGSGFDPLAPHLDIALVGDEGELTARLEDLASLGVTDLIASIKAPSPDDEARTRAFLGTMVDVTAR